MHLRAKSIRYKENYTLNFHPLTKVLYKELMQAFQNGSKNYLETADNFLESAHDFPSNIIYVISSDSNTYDIVGGCFSPLFNKANIISDNTLMIKLETSKSYDVKGKSEKYIEKTKRRIEKQFNQEIIDLIYLDFLKAISILALKKPGAMDESLRTITKEYKSDIWSEVFDEKCNYMRQVDLAKLLNVDQDTIRNHSS